MVVDDSALERLDLGRYFVDVLRICRRGERPAADMAVVIQELLVLTY